MLQYLLYHLRIFNTVVRHIDNDLRLTTALLTLLNPEAAPSIANTRFNRCAHVIEYPLLPG